MVGFNAKIEAGTLRSSFDASNISICRDAHYCGRDAHVCASHCICGVDVDAVFGIYVVKAFPGKRTHSSSVFLAFFRIY